MWLPVDWTDPSRQLALLTSAPDRRPGSRANDDAVALIAHILRRHDWRVSTPEFPVVGWRGGVGALHADGRQIMLQPSPYGIGVEATGELMSAGDLKELAAIADLVRQSSSLPAACLGAVPSEPGT